MINVKVTCNCGAVYEVIETKGPSRDTKPLRVPNRIENNAKRPHAVGAHVAEGHKPYLKFI